MLNENVGHARALLKRVVPMLGPERTPSPAFIERALDMRSSPHPRRAIPRAWSSSTRSPVACSARRNSDLFASRTVLHKFDRTHSLSRILHLSFTQSSVIESICAPMSNPAMTWKVRRIGHGLWSSVCARNGPRGAGSSACSARLSRAKPWTKRAARRRRFHRQPARRARDGRRPSMAHRAASRPRRAANRIGLTLARDSRVESLRATRSRAFGTLPQTFVHAAVTAGCCTRAPLSDESQQQR